MFAISQKRGIRDIRAWRLPHSKDMDVYFGHPVGSIPKTEVPDNNPAKPYILLTKRSELAHFKEHEIFCRGNYSIIIMHCQTPGSQLRLHPMP